MSGNRAACHTDRVTAPREYQIKAAYLLNLIRFVNWPVADSDIEQRTNICLLGKNPFGRHLERLNNLRANEKIIQVSYHDNHRDGHLIDDYEHHKVGHSESHTDLSQCEIIFISSDNTDQKMLLDMANTVAQQALTVGEAEDFIDQGGLVALVVNYNRIELNINLSEAKRSGFEISGNLLEITQKVK